MKYSQARPTHESDEKRKFRGTSVWKNFRYKLKKERKVDYLTQKPLGKGFQVHHCDLNPDNYKNLIEDNFVTVNKTSHEILHWAYRYSWPKLILRIVKTLYKMTIINKRELDEEETWIVNSLNKIIITLESKEDKQYELDFS